MNQTAYIWSWHWSKKKKTRISENYRLCEQSNVKAHSTMADQQLLPHQNGTANGCIVAAVTGTTTTNNNQSNNNDINKLKNCSNGDVNGPNLINQKKLSANKIICEFSATNPNETPSCEPPDGGARAWCVMVSAFLCNSIIFGIINTYGTVYIKLEEYLTEIGDTEAASKACKFKEFISIFQIKLNLTKNKKLNIWLIILTVRRKKIWWQTTAFLAVVKSS